MAELKICRICLQTGVKVYKYDLFQLKLCYEELTTIKINQKDQLPQYFCYECAMLLYKFHKFKQKCYQGQKVLEDLLLNGPITYEVIDRFDRQSVNLQSMLGIITVNKHVKTFLINDRNNDMKFISDDDASDEKPEVNNDLINENSNEKDIEDDLNIITNDRTTIDSTTDDNSDSDDVVNSDYDPIRESNLPSFTKIYIPVKEVIKTEEISVVNEGIENIDNRNHEFIEIKCTASTPDKITINTGKNVFTKRMPKKRENVRNVTEKTKDNFTKSLKQCLDPSKWRKISLTEEEAVTEFEKRARNPKYVQATYPCKDCYKFFSKEDTIKRHMKLRHNPSIGPFECRFCHNRFEQECNLRKHIRMHYTKYECLVCNLVVSIETSARMHEESHLDLTRTCNHCGAKFRHLSTFYSHLRTHRSKHVCALCGASFVSAIGLQQHKHLRHVDETEDPKVQQDSETFCERCQIKFETKNAYEKHLKSSALHADIEIPHVDRPAFKRSYENLGAKSKKKRKPTTCHHCGKHFGSKALCMSHHQKEHPGTSFCPPNERHICKICGASLAPGSINMHYNMHTREKVHGCDTCGRQFHSTTGLKRHLLTHTGEKPFECPLCDKRFTQSNSMKLHYRTFHLNEPYPKRARSRKRKDIHGAVPVESGDDS